jgi:uncharacterized Zn-binding protein involved in type VI secretion
MQQAARIGDNHTCPMTTPAPHVGGPINNGCSSVLTENLPQAIISAMATCVGPLDVVTSAASTVHIEGMFAARMTDMTAHGGTVVVGAATVLIGGPTHHSRPVQMLPDGTVQYGGSILIPFQTGRPDYQARALAAYVRLDTTEGMNDGLNRLEATGHHVTVTPYVKPHGWTAYNAYCQASSADAGTPGVGSDSTIGWDPDVQGFGPEGTTADWEQPGSDMLLGHETGHSIHNAEGSYPANGAFVQNADGTQGVNIAEDRNTVGLPEQTYNNPTNPADQSNGHVLPSTEGSSPFTENSLRSEYEERGVRSPALGEPVGQRPSYYPSSWGGQPF